MAQYGIYVFCNDCGDTHPMGIGMELDNGPAEKASIGDIYKGKPVPQDVVKIFNNYIQCPKTGKMFIQKDHDQIFLVRVK